MDQEYHQMIFEKVNSYGEETWNCPTCGRRLSVTWEPKFKKRVLAIGDENAAHAGSKGSLQMESKKIVRVRGISAEQEPGISIEDPSLAPWAAWVDKVGFENLWDDQV
jgi:hypothetical protein